MSTYDPKSLESVLLYMRQKFGINVFRDAKRMHAIIIDLSPGLKPYANILRQLAERGVFAELEATSDGERAMMKARYILENELLLGVQPIQHLTNVLRTLYGIAAPPQAVTPPKPQPVPQPKPQAQAAAPSTNIVKRGKCGDNVTYTLDENGVLTISGTGSMYDLLDEQMHPCDAPWRNERNNITRVVIQDGVTTIGLLAFSDCKALQSVSIPDSMTDIRGIAFMNCTALTSVSIPNGVKRIMIGAFAACEALTSVDIPDSVKTIGKNAFAGCRELKSVSIPADASIGEGVFYPGTHVTRRGARPKGAEIVKRGKCGDNVHYTLDANGVLTIFGNGSMREYERDSEAAFLLTPWITGNVAQVVICDGVTAIPSFAFYFCGNLTSATIPASVTRITGYAFAHCSKLKNVTIANGVKEIKYSAFEDCKSLESVTIPDSVTEIGAEAFKDCPALKSVSLSAKTKFHSGLFKRTFPLGVRVTRR